MDREGIWAHLQTLVPLLDRSQFVVWSGNLDIATLSKWPMGEIKAIPHTCAVTWKVESPASPAGYKEAVQEKMTPLLYVQEAWQLLHTQVPRLFEKWIIFELARKGGCSKGRS
jgi:hypothetical protein